METQPINLLFSFLSACLSFSLEVNIVVLPLSGTGRPIQIYDGRRSLNESEIEQQQASVEKPQTTEDSGRGEIIYFRDSDDEMPDSDEDPDDDLDI